MKEKENDSPLWSKQSLVKKIFKEIAEELNLTPDEVSGVLVCLFDSVVTGVMNKKIKMFRFPNWGRLNQLGYLSKRGVEVKEQRKLQKRALYGFGERQLRPDEIEARQAKEI